MTKQEWLKQYKHLSARDQSLLSRAYDTLETNTMREKGMPWGDMPCITPWQREKEGISNVNRGIWNWDSAFHAMAVSRYDTDLAKSCIEAFCQFQLEDGMFPDVVFANGHVVNDLSKPPVMAWATELVYERCGDRAFLERMYARLVKNEAFWCEQRQYQGLFYFSSQKDVEKDNYQRARYESGWDNSPRYDTPIVNLWAIDLNCFMVQTYRALAEISEHLGLDDAQKWLARGEKVAQLINERMYDEERGVYADTDKYTGKQIRTLSPASFMPLYIGIAPHERAEAMEKIAADPQKFFPYMPTVTYDDPAYSTDYWRGPVWLNVAYFAAKGLKDYGFDKTADAIKEAILNMCDQIRDGIYENYDSKAMKGLSWHNFSWSAAFIMEFILHWEN